jgi:hypothetical protein
MAGAVDGIRTISQIADDLKLSRQAVSKAVARLLKLGHPLPVERDQRGRVIAVDAAAFSVLTGRTQDSSKRRPPPASSDVGEFDPRGLDPRSLDEARRQQIVAQTRLAHMKLQAEGGGLIRRDLYEQNLQRLGEELVRILDLMAHADDIALAAERSGGRELRLTLRDISLKLRTRMADALAQAKYLSPERDDPLAEAEETTPG